MFKLLVPALLLIALAASAVSACSCIFSPPCSQTWKSGEVIFVGTVTGKIPADTPETAGRLNYLAQRFAFQFSVSESFRGPAIAGQEIVVYTGAGGGDCGYPFAVGESYLVYASNYKGQLTTGICAPTSPTVMVPSVVRQLRALQSGQPADALFGTIGTAPQGVGYDDLIEAKPLADIRVRAIGDGIPERSTTTDRDGSYSFESLPPGAYRVEVDLPKGMSTWQKNKGETITVTIGPEGSTGCRTDVFARPDGRVTGVVVDDSGRGVPGFVTIKPADPKEAEAASRRGGMSGYTTEDGNFTLWLLPPGRYRLLFHPKIDGQVNFRVPATWSDIVDLGFGQRIENFRIRVPTRTPPQ